jgi:hypothetical protein
VTRHIRFSEPRSGLSARCALLDDHAPQSCEFLWALASRRAAFEAVHAMWTGPELSVPIPADLLPAGLPAQPIPEENATAYPEAGEIALFYAAAGSAKGLPPGAFYDIGLFYAGGARLLMPFGWIRANICARIVAEDLAHAAAAIKTIRRNGVCQLTIEAG